MSLHQILSKRVLYPLDRLRTGDVGELRYLREFEESQFLDAPRLDALRLERLRSLIAHAEACCPYYAKTFAAAGFSSRELRSLDDLKHVPVLDKAEVQVQRDAMVARGWPRDDLIENQTGGSTGTPVSFFMSHDRRRSRAAATKRHNRWAGWEVGHKVACIWGAARDAPPRGRLLARVRNALIDRELFLDAGAITEERLAGFRRALNRFRPDVVLAYARAATLFARYLDSVGGLDHAPRSIVTSAETLDADDRALVERVFRAPVFNRYGSREVSVLASECERHDGLHVMAEGLIVEIVTPDGPAGPLVTGAILVTDLLNRAMPLIRYRIGDVGSWSHGPCACGRALPRLAHVAGRVTDFLVGDGGQLVSGVFLATYVVANRPSLGQVQIVQTADRRVVYRIAPGGRPPLPEDLEYLRQQTAKYLGETIPVAFEHVAGIAAEASGKFIFSRSEASASFF